MYVKFTVSPAFTCTASPRVFASCPFTFLTMEIAGLSIKIELKWPTKYATLSFLSSVMNLDTGFPVGY